MDENQNSKAPSEGAEEQLNTLAEKAEAATAEATSEIHTETSLPESAAEKKPSVMNRIWTWLKAIIPGLALCAVIAVPSWFLGKLVPVIGSAVFAIVIGMVIAFFRRPKWLDTGIRFTSKKILQASIVFLGFGMNFITVVQVGGDSIDRKSVV